MIKMRLILECIGEGDDSSPRMPHQRYLLEAKRDPQRLQVFDERVNRNGRKIQVLIR